MTVLEDKSFLDEEMSKRLEKLKLDLETEMLEEIRRLRTYFANRFLNLERRKPHQSWSDLTFIKSLKEVVLSQQIQQEDFLRRNVEMKMHLLRNELFDELRKHQYCTLDDRVHKKSFEQKSNTLSKQRQGGNTLINNYQLLIIIILLLRTCQKQILLKFTKFN